MIWFSSDHHFGHKNIISHSKRPFQSVNEMDEKLIHFWNECVKKEDTVYYLGDIMFHSNGEMVRKILDSLNGKIILVKGNHDKNIKYKERFSEICEYKEIYHDDTSIEGGKRPIVMCHYAFKTWNKKLYGAWNLFGHSHGNIQIEWGACDVGVDSWNYKPVCFEQIKECFNKIKNE